MFENVELHFRSLPQTTLGISTNNKYGNQHSHNKLKSRTLRLISSEVKCDNMQISDWNTLGVVYTAHIFFIIRFF